MGISSYPRTQLLDADGSALTVAKVESEYNVGTASLYLFNYPLRNEPNFLLNLAPVNGQMPTLTNPGAWGVYGGVGTHNSIVAYSAICQHLGCPAPAIAYYPPGTCPQTFPSLTNVSDGNAEGRCPEVVGDRRGRAAQVLAGSRAVRDDRVVVPTPP